MLRAVIFDFDGVIADTEILHLRAFNAVLVQHGVEISEEEYYKHYLGLTDVECFGELVGQGRLGIDEQKIAELVREKNEVFERLVKDDGGIIDGVVDFLEMLPPGMVVQRLTGDPVRSELVAPLWALEKTENLKTLRERLKSRDTWQGRLYGG